MRVLLKALSVTFLVVAGLAVTASAQKTYIAGYGVDKVYYFNPIKGSSAVIPMIGNPFDVVITGDGSTAYVTLTTGDAIGVINVATNQVVTTIPTAPFPVRMSIDNSESRLYVTHGGTSVVTTIDITRYRNGQRANRVVTLTDWTAQAPSAGHGFAVAVQESRNLLTVGTLSGYVLFFNTSGRAPRLIGRTWVSSGVSDLCFSADGAKVYAALDSGATLSRGVRGNLLVMDARSQAVRKGLSLGNGADPIGSLAMRPNGDDLYASGPGSGQIYDINTRTDRLSDTILLAAGSSPYSLAAFNLGAAQGGLTLFITDIAQGQLDMYANPTKELTTISFDPSAFPFGMAVTSVHWQVP